MDNDAGEIHTIIQIDYDDGCGKILEGVNNILVNDAKF